MKQGSIQAICAGFLFLLGGLSLRGQVIVELAPETPDAIIYAGQGTPFVISALGMERGIASVSLVAAGVTLAEAVQVGLTEWVAPHVIFPDAGTWELVAQATDESGMIWRSPVVSITVEYAPPEVRILAPLEGGRHPVGTLLPVQLAAYDPFGMITTVELWLNGQLILSYAWDENNVGWFVDELAPNQVQPAEQPFRAHVQMPSAGTYRLKARATSTTGLSAFTEERLIEVEDPASAPVLNLLYPLSGSQFLPGTRLPVQVEGHDPGGLIEQVEFLLNGVVVDTVTAIPFRTEVQLPSTGAYRLQARATTTFGQMAYSQEALLLTGPPDGVTPRVIVDFPLPLGAGDTANDVSQASNMFFNATVQDPDGGLIEAVYFYLNGQLLGEAESRLGNTFALYHEPNATGNYILTAAAVDADGRVGWSLPVLLDVGPLERPLPRASIARAFTEGIAGLEVTLRAAADGGLIPVDRVDFLIDGVYVGSTVETDADGLYSFTWTPAEAGEYEVRARVVQIDPDDSTWDTWVVTEPADLSISEPVGKLPAVSLTLAPEPSGLTIGSRLMLLAEAYDPEGTIDRVEFYADDTQLGTVRTKPYFFPYELDRSGRHRLYSRIVDSDGNAVSSNIVEAEVSQKVSSGGLSIALELPEEPREGEPMVIAAVLTGSVLGPSAIHYYANGQLIGLATEGVSSFEWVPPLSGPVGFFAAAVLNLADGSKQTLVSPIEVREIRAGGITGQTDLPPVIERFTANVPAGWARLGQRLVWEIEATDDDGLASIEVFRNGELIPTNSILPVEVVDTIGDMGIFRYRARVRDTGGNITESAVREIRATRGSPALVYFLPVDPLSVYTGGDAVSIEAFASIPEEPAGIPPGSVRQVDFFLNGALVGTALSEPYRVSIEPSSILVGTNQLVAVAETDTGLRSASSYLDITGIEGSLPEILRFRTNATSGVQLPGATLDFTIEAEDAGGIAFAELLLFGEVIAEAEADSPAFSVLLETVGRYVFTARVTNLDGHQVESDPIEITVVHPNPLASDKDFVYQTFVDLLFRIPEPVELTDYADSLARGALTRERFVAGLLGVGESNAHTAEYQDTRNALLGLTFSNQTVPTRGALRAALAEVRAGGLETVLARQMPSIAEAYRAETGRELPGVASNEEAVDAFVSWLFYKKYAFGPNEAQVELARWHFRALGRDAYASRFLADTGLIALPEGWATTQLGFRFSTEQPPESPLLQQLEAASLLVNVLRIEPTPEEVELLSRQLLVTQVASVVADPRYAGRFASTFEAIEVHRDGWLRSGWFGWFNKEREPWVYHSEQGWVSLRTSGQSEDNLWYYDPGFGWMWTQAALYPYIFDFAGGRWLWHWRKPFVPGQRLYYDLQSEDWIRR